MYGVSNRTVQRWLAELKDDVLQRMREGLKARLALNASELDSLLRLMQSQLQVSLQRVLGSAWAG
jgi:RNA polymerase sigma-70 factor (ECF subfamily)